MRPAPQVLAPDVWIVREQACFKLWKPLSLRASEPGPSNGNTVQSASVVEDRETGRSRGFAFVEMSTNAEATAAIEQFNGKEIAGRALKVNEAKPREPRNGASGRNFGGNRGGGGYRGGNYGGSNGGGNREPRW
jgi:cold-inducible RNA-binding protein